MSGSLLRSLKSLRLPLRHDVEAQVVDAFADELERLGVVEDESWNWVVSEHDALKSTGTSSPALNRVVSRLLEEAARREDPSNRIPATRIASHYFSVYTSLTRDHAYTHEEAITALGYSLLVIDMAVRERMSAAQTSKVLRGLSANLPFSRQSVKLMTSAYGCEIVISRDEVSSLIDGDSMREQELLADSSFREAIDVIASVADSLGCRVDIGEALQALCPRMEGAQVDSGATAHLQMLHFQCVICEFCDHAVADVYEFSPRGVAAEAVFNRYTNSLANAGNPFLNNAKSVEVLDDGWVRSKKAKERAKARGLLDALLALNSLGFGAKRELAFWIRLWLSRIIRVAGENEYEISRPLSMESVARVMGEVASKPTETFGVLEQRVVDLCAAAIHPGFPSRGIGDSVNATNRSTSKFGDCEFADSESFLITAYEAHAGYLTAWYVEEHLRTLERSIAERKQELGLLGGSKGWSLEVVFVAHAWDDCVPEVREIDGVRVSFTVSAFSALLERVATEVGSEMFEHYVTAPVWDARTPSSVRRKFLQFAFPVESLVALDIQNRHERNLAEEPAEYVAAYEAALAEVRSG